jgi:D-galactarolactone cycloisomerase
MTNNPVSIKSVCAHVFRYPLSEPVVTSFGEMNDRPMLLVAVTTDSGKTGWGEIWCNFPAVGAEHRARLVDSIFAPLLIGGTFKSPSEALMHMRKSTETLAIQCGESGPISQVIAGLDVAIWDIAGQQAGEPLWKLLGGESPKVRVYASGLNPTLPEQRAAESKKQGHTAFKLKVGFGKKRDVTNLKMLRKTLGDDVRLMADANQGWALDEAIDYAPYLAEFNLYWLEEPLRADVPWTEWQSLKHGTDIPLAAGENIASDAMFDDALRRGIFDIVQPDLAKWGGITACFPLAQRIINADLIYCPHYLGGGIGLVASAHVLAATEGEGMLEIDANPNPLRADLCGSLNTIENGHAYVPSDPGLGVTPDLEKLAQFSVAHS